jgi:hypothetical protein
MRGAILLGCALVIACGDSPREPEPLPVVVDERVAKLERSIASDLAGRLAHATIVKVKCTPPTRCEADLGDTKLPIVLAPAPGGWTWRIDGKLVRTAPIEAYLRATVEDLGANQRISCGGSVRSVAPGERIACTLERGGTAFVTVRDDGSFAVELSMDKDAAKARASDVADKELTEKSRAARGSDDDGDD